MVGGGLGSGNNSGLNSYNNSSDESARGGSTNSKRGRGKNTIASRSSVRNRSSENHLSASARNPIIEELQGETLKISDENQNRAILTAESEADDGAVGANLAIP